MAETTHKPLGYVIDDFAYTVPLPPLHLERELCNLINSVHNNSKHARDVEVHFPYAPCAPYPITQRSIVLRSLSKLTPIFIIFLSLAS